VSEGNPNGIFTVTIDKAELGPQFYWAIWCTAMGFWSPNTGYSSYPQGFIWGTDVANDHYELCSLPGVVAPTGNAFFTPSAGNLTGLTAVALGSLPGAAQATKPGDFPDGLFSFDVTGLSYPPGQTVTVTIVLPPGSAPTQYWKYHVSEGGWIQIPMTIVGPPNVIRITLVDGGLGDDDQTVNGVIVDQGGPITGPVGWETHPVSKMRVLLPWIALLAAIAAGASLLVIKRRRVHT
jgi:hypothetical protein